MYSANQVRQLYVVDDNHPLAVKVHNSVDHNGGKLISMEYTDDLGNVQLADLIEKNDIRIISVKAAPTVDAREASITIATPPTGAFEAYLTIVAPSFYGDTNENSEVFPVNIRMAAGSTAAQVATAFANKINGDKNLSNHFYASTSSAVLKIAELFNLNDHRLGVYRLFSCPFTIAHSHYVDLSVTDHLCDALHHCCIPLQLPTVLSANITYGVTAVTDSTAHTAGVPNNYTLHLNGSYELAQLEWFCHGFRGDVYREKAFPNNYEYKGLITPGAAQSLYTCDIHYFWHGYGNQVDKSEKTITFVGSSTDMTAIKTAIDNATSNNRIPAAQQAGGNG